MTQASRAAERGQPLRQAVVSPADATRRGFDRISPFYDVLARLFPGRRIERSQCLFLNELANCRRALIVGGGNGGFLRELLRGGFTGEVVYLDISGAMIKRARETIAGLPEARVDFRRGDVRDLDAIRRFDLICTNYVLDVFTPGDLNNVMTRLDRTLVPGGLWLCTDFSEPGGGPARRLFQRSMLGGLYAFFGQVCGIRPRRLPPIEPLFAQRGYVASRREELAGGLLWSALFSRDETAREH